MRTFKEFPKGSECPICGTNDNKESTLIGIIGTEDGNNMQAAVFHTDCINLTYMPDKKMLVQIVKVID